jgi:hypothetical protein
MTKMGKSVYLLCVLFAFFSLELKAHDTYFAFAEVEYNDLNGTLEATLTLSTHDLERLLQEKEIIKGALSSTPMDSMLVSSISVLINSTFYFSLPNKEAIHWEIEGIENTLTGTTNIYLSSAVKQVTDTFSVRFDIFMDRYPEQQNKMTFIYHENKTTRVFLNAQRTDTFKLKPL